MRIKDSFPEISQTEAFQNALQSFRELQFDAAQLKALDEALRPARRLKSLLGVQKDATRLSRVLEKAILSLRHFRHFQVHNPLTEPRSPLPAYRLEEDDEL